MRVWIIILDKMKILTTEKFNAITMFFCICLYVLGCLLYQVKVYNIWWFEHALVFMVFLFIGQLYKNHSSCKISLYYSILYILLIVTLQLLGLKHPSITAVINARIEDFPLLMILALSGSMSILGIAKYINKNYILEYLGKNSLIIYCLHISTMGCIYHIGKRLIGAEIISTTSFSVFQLVASILLLFCFAWVLNLKYARLLQGKFQ